MSVFRSNNNLTSPRNYEDSSVHSTVAGLSASSTAERINNLNSKSHSVVNLQNIASSPSPTSKSAFGVRLRRGFNSVGSFLKLSRSPSTNSFQSASESSCNSSCEDISETPSKNYMQSSSENRNLPKSSSRNTRIDAGHSDKIRFGVAQSHAKKDQDRYDVRVGKSKHGNSLLYASVFDGHGTSSFAADICVRDLYNEVCKQMETKPSGDQDDADVFFLGENEYYDEEMCQIPSDDAIEEAYVKIHEIVASAARHEPRTGACVVTVFAEENDLGDIVGKVGWAGDCSAMVIDKKGTINVLTRFHRLDANPEELTRFNNASHSPRQDIMTTRFWQEELKKAESKNTRARAHSFVSQRQLPNGEFTGENCIFSYTGGISLQVTRSIGDTLAARSIIPNPEIVSFKLAASESGSRMILFSDGLSDACSFEEIAKIAKRIDKPHKAAKKLASHSKRKRLYNGQSADDITVVVIDFGDFRR